MCGIVGIVNFSDKKVDIKRYIKSMADTIKHRGPDDEGFVLFSNSDILIAGGNDTPQGVWNSDFFYSPQIHINSIKDDNYNVALGHRRLSIIDLSPGGHQPMCSKDKKIWIVYNGEIYNYIELREELKSYGYTFSTNSDTEVILAAYDKWGFDCLNKFNGMWAFVIYDKRKNLFFGARDRFGVKPLYYYLDSGYFVFASEIKALIQLPFLKFKPNNEIIWDYLILGLVSHNQKTFFEGIYSLEPANYFVLDFNGNLSVYKYWQISPNIEFEKFNEVKFKKSVEYFREILFDAIKLRLRSDVSIGSCLSGGLDSSTIVCIVNQLLREKGYSAQIGGKQKTFTSAFEDKRFDEREFVKEIIKHTGVEPFYVFPTAEDLVKDIDDLIYYQEEPFCSTSIYAQYRVMKLAKEAGVKVILDGQGGDELLAGYYSYYHAYFFNLLKAREYKLFLTELFESSKVTDYNILYFLFQMDREIFRQLPRPFQIVLLRKLRNDLKYIHRDFLISYSDRINEWIKERGFGDLNKRLLADTTKYNLPGLLKYEDRNSMRFSIEARVPFADDHRLTEFIASLPASYKIHNGWTKYILRYAIAGVVPEKIRWRRDKMGFVTPEKIWLSKITNEIKRLIFTIEDDYIDNNLLMQDIDSLFLNPKDQIGVSELWRIINLKLWIRRFF